MAQPGVVRVLAGVAKPPLLETCEASIVEFRDRFGDLTAIFHRQFSDDMWVFVTCKDPDWETTLVRLGYMDSPADIRSLLGAGRG